MAANDPSGPIGGRAVSRRCGEAATPLSSPPARQPTSRLTVLQWTIRRPGRSRHLGRAEAAAGRTASATGMGTVLWRASGPAPRSAAAPSPGIVARPPRRQARRRPPGPRQPSAPRPARLALLVLIGDEDTVDGRTWRRGRSVLLEIDKNLAAAPQADYRVRVLRSTGDAAMSEPRSAGKLTRRDIRRPTASLDFPRVLGIIRTAVQRDLAAAGMTGSPAIRPSIVFFAADVPLADAVTATLYSELARKASITWIVPGANGGPAVPDLQRRGRMGCQRPPGCCRRSYDPAPQHGKHHRDHWCRRGDN